MNNKLNKLAPRKVFISRLINSLSFGLLLIIISLTVGVLGYHELRNMSWIDSFLNASMILGGMGPIDMFEGATQSAKLFGGLYAIFSGVLFISGTAIVISPLIHRLLHRFHLEDMKE